MSRPVRVLLVDDSRSNVSRLISKLRRGGYYPRFARVETAEAMHDALAKQSWDLVIANATNRKFASLSALEWFEKSGSEVPMILISNERELQPKLSASGTNGTVRIAKGTWKSLLPIVKQKLANSRERKRSNRTEKVPKQSLEKDSLTRLANRRLLHDHLQRCIQRSRLNNRSFALLIMGLDRFKEVNHNLGPHNGDLLLKKVARRFEMVLSKSTIKARLGGDEFAAILPDVSRDQALTIARKILKALERPFLLKELPIDLSASIGMAFCPEHGSDSNVLLQRADVAMYVAKQHGRGFSVYDSAEDPYDQQQFTILGGLRRAIESDELILHFQPKIDMRTARVSGVEALIRRDHPQMGLIFPDQFVPLAERTGLVHALSLWVIKAALDQCRRWSHEGLNIPVAVNLSARNLHDPLLPQRVAKLLAERRLHPQSLEFEITEGVIMTDTLRALDVLSRLNEMGVRLYIDDFGTGYSSLAYLKKLPVDGIKIDKSFVIPMAQDENDAVIVRSTIDLGHNLGLQVIAEGVESGHVWQHLHTLGCDAAQGYHMARPMPPEELELWLAESRWGLSASEYKTS